MAKAVEALLGEHEIARGFTQGMLDSAKAWENGDESAVQETIKNARNYAALLHDHILHENGVVYPATNWLMPITDQNHLDELCAQMEDDSTTAHQFIEWLDAIEAQTA